MADVSAVLFDMDGTLVDSDAVVSRAWLRWCRLRGLDHAAVMRVTPGRPARETIPELAPWLSAEEQAADAAALLDFERADVEGVVAAHGAQALLAALDGWGVPWAVVTSADRPLALTRLAAAGIAAPAVLVTISEIERAKPHPEGYLTAAALLGVDARKTLVVEDAPAGVLAGKAAGSLVAGLRAVPGADFNVAHLADLHARASRTGTGLRLHTAAS
ncbi:HAD family hydrolase [Dactylosporangium fulvum]|uniref:HAD-IA family hydrolase n=1 Tax=Dactylosporangium fulvum TaxID=53359 RepID=A0ABY5W400_9ACTN|nr:HAD-IA family hydrolase [Dactylosporangium fulvum]UWP84189.1 HAD-IA family hydrolase [Dactylosporangium fulvum]